MKSFTLSIAAAAAVFFAVPAHAWGRTSRSVEDLGVMPQVAGTDDNMVS